MGIYFARGAKASNITSKVRECTIPAMGVRPPFFTFVAVLAIAPVAGMPPKNGDTILAIPWAISS